ncbi:hypothetical protein [Paenibacillus ginsengarvi]|uniref:hypothetical protein n=1 Tax=Paenibacillus ginsengarvi TaxID=400777 RepID=UPI0018741983|nr:hypothetical protein [Paenibacillus ginsengarvi]
MKRNKKLYIVLTDTGTWLTKLIKTYTKDPHNHASLAFDETLRDVYSFGRKEASSPLRGGFVKEDMHSPLFMGEERNTTCAVYECEIGHAAYERIVQAVKEFELSENEYKYNGIGLLGVAFGTKISRSNAYFCSQFVSAMFLKGGVSLSGKCPELTTPGDLSRSPHVKLVYTGSLRHYAPLRKRFAAERSRKQAVSV